MWAFFFNLKHVKTAEKSYCIILCHVRLSPTVCVCVCMCEVYSERTPKVAPETSLQSCIAQTAVSTKQVWVSGIYTCREATAYIYVANRGTPFSCSKDVTIFHFCLSEFIFSCFFSHFFFFFFYSYLKFPPGHKVLHSAKDFYSRSLGVGQPVNRRGHFLVCRRGEKDCLLAVCLSKHIWHFYINFMYLDRASLRRFTEKKTINVKWNGTN